MVDISWPLLLKHFSVDPIWDLSDPLAWLKKLLTKIEIKEKKTLINTPRRDTNRYSNCTLFSKSKWI